MSTKHKRPQRPKLERKFALKNVNYDASISSTSSSSSFDDQSTRRTRSLDSPVNRTSFRIEGIDEGEFDRICRSLGFTGPEDFAIPAAAWEARKNNSPSSNLNFPSSRFKDQLYSPSEEEEVDVSALSAGFKGSVSVNDTVVSDGGVMSERISVRSSRGGEGIKGVRPPLLAPPGSRLPVLAPPPVKKSMVVDNSSSTWDLCRSFGPDDEDSVSSPGNVSVVEEVEGNEDVNEQIVMVQNGNGARLSDSTGFSESCSDLSDFENGDDVYGMIREPMSAASPTISPNGVFGCGIKCWQKGDFLGSGSFGTVYEGFTE